MQFARRTSFLNSLYDELKRGLRAWECGANDDRKVTSNDSLAQLFDVSTKLVDCLTDASDYPGSVTRHDADYVFG
jgi:hypothetical protein